MTMEYYFSYHYTSLALTDWSAAPVFEEVLRLKTKLAEYCAVLHLSC